MAKHKPEFHVKRIVDSISALSNDHHIPSALVIFRKKQPEVHGSPNLKNEIVTQLTNNPGFLSSMKRDLQDLSAAGEDEEIVPTFSLKNRKPPPLPREWSLQSHNLNRSYLPKCIMVTYWRSGGKKLKIKYFAEAGDEMKPMWWLEADFPWQEFSNPTHKLTYPGPGDFNSFLKRSIEAFFVFHNWDINEWPFMKISHKKYVDCQRKR